MLEFVIDIESLGGVQMSYFFNNVEKNNDFLYITKNKYFVDKTRLLEKFNKIMD